MGSLAQTSTRRYNAVTDPDNTAQVANVINNILAGKLNNTSTVTLTANAASTTLTDSRIGANSVISLMPTTANAASAISTTYFDTFADGSCVIHHSNNAQVDKTFSVTIIG